MIKQSIKFVALVFLAFTTLGVVAEENKGEPVSGNSGKTQKSNKIAQNCSPATSRTDLDVNNVRARLLAGGDMWWDLQGEAKYEIPKIPVNSNEVSKHSLFAGALWIGGIDAGGQLKIAAQTYRQSGNDFWTGPLDTLGQVNEDVCSKFDKHWEITRSEIDAHIADYEKDGAIEVNGIPRSIREWPARGNPFAVGANNIPLNLDPNKDLAPFIDIDGDGIYNPENGDYPDVDGDQAIWWVYNDKGNIHNETGGEVIGLEIKTTAFAFATNDEINDMTFYDYEVTNFSSSALDSVFFGQWVDADLGNAFDDFVGCDTARDLGICYNGDAEDEGATGYGENPPIVGVDFFQGPIKYVYASEVDSIDSETDSIVDTTRLGMSKFLYYNNDFSTVGNPEVASHYYGYLSGTWKDGTPFTFGGNGNNTGEPTDFMFPSDPSSTAADAWSECAEGNTPFDRRFLQSSGPFTLEPGAENEVVVGVVWVNPPNQSGCQANFDAIRLADDKAQALYDNDFELIDGPDAPDLKIRELDEEIIISMDNYFTEDTELYEETDPVIKSIIDGLNDPDITDSTYNFQGYIVYQLANNQVSNYRDVTQARPIFQVDLNDSVGKIVNFTRDETVEALVPELMVDGEDEGIRHTFRVREDAFASGSQNLINNQPYYFSVVAYAHNNYLPYEPGNPQSQLRPYLEGRSNIKVYSAVPHLTGPEAGGTRLNSEYGIQPEITRLDGIGNGYNVIDITEETRNEILANNFAPEATYQKGAGPIDVKIYDPMKVADADFELQLIDTFPRFGKVLDPRSRWRLINRSNGDTIFSERTIQIQNEQVISEYGISVTIKQTGNPGRNAPRDNGFLEATKEFEDPQNSWLTGLQDGDARFGGGRFSNWIRSGDAFDTDNPTPYDDYYYPSGGNFISQDPNEIYEDVINGTFAPAALTGGFNASAEDNPYAPGRQAVTLFEDLKLDSLASVNLVLTDDKSKWTKCVVVETQADDQLAQGGVSKLVMRDHPSLNKDGTYSGTERGRSWFPGYAINVETGKRLNIVFGEDSWLTAENGDDMIWNPTSNTQLQTGPSGRTYVFGGKHYVYISNTEYDEGKKFHDLYNSPSSDQIKIRNVFSRMQWITIPLLEPGSELKPFADGLIPNKTTIRLRVGKSYTDYNTTPEGNAQPRYFFSLGEYAPEKENLSVADSALDDIRVVPNPYYAYSDYEGGQLDRRVKITNLPASCRVSIFTTDGVMIRRFDRDDPLNNTEGAPTSEENFDTSLEWDLRNEKNVPIASGMYIIHVEAPGIGEKTVKWFGAMRPLDFDNF